MVFEKFNDRMYTKLANANDLYAKMMFKPAFKIENPVYLQTKEHFRMPPEDGYQPIYDGTAWGGMYQNIWVKGSFTVPEEYAGKKLYCIPHTNAVETLVFINGKPKGIINSKNEEFIGATHSATLITFGAKAGEKFDIDLECYAWHYDPGVAPFDNLNNDYGNEEGFIWPFHDVTIGYMDTVVKDFVFSLKNLLQVVRNISGREYLKAKAQKVLMQVFPLVRLDPYHCPDEEWHDGLKQAIKVMDTFFTGNSHSGVTGKAGIIGHSHMDTAWLWPVDETVRKCARTYANALWLMEQFPDYKFVQSSMLHCNWMKEYYPDIFADMKKRVAEGRYEPNGGVWVECDCNITSGESMIRQFLKGQLFSRENFDYTADSFWLPDTFGYNGNIPQIMRGCGAKYFYTTKLGWNEFNRFPFESFVWKGIDGSDVITHFNITHCAPDVENITNDVDALQHKNVDDSRLIAFGFGDGGGGPTFGMMEDADRAMRTNGIPETKYMTISEFGKQLEAHKEDLPVYSGELYLELHRGTLTQKHDIKRYNRKAEFALRDMEILSVISGKKADAEKYDKLVKTLLLNQFHDIIPGTCITKVYERAIPELKGVISACEEDINESLAAMSDNSDNKITVFNTLSFDRCGTFAIENIDGYLKGAACQKTKDILGRSLTYVSGQKIASFGSKTFELTGADEEGTSPFKYDGKHLSTPYAEISFDDMGYIASFIDKPSGRELRKPDGNPLGVFLKAEDIPVFWDNWDTEYDRRMKTEVQTGFQGRTVISDGAVMMQLRSDFKTDGESVIHQDMMVYADTPRIDFHTVVDWKDKHQILKVGFDIDIVSKTARNEIQYGFIDRPTTENDIHEMAKFEVCNYKWTDISENNFGVAVLNDCKYGISVTGCDMELTLHRGGIRPDYTGDEGEHEMTYSLLPHAGAMNAENVVRPSYELNIKPVVAKGECAVNSFIQLDKSNIIIEAVKPAELIDNAYVIRLYECTCAKTFAEITLSDAKRVYTANMLEDKQEECTLDNGKVKLDFRPFEIKTIIVER